MHECRILWLQFVQLFTRDSAWDFTMKYIFKIKDQMETGLHWTLKTPGVEGGNKIVMHQSLHDQLLSYSHWVATTDNSTYLLC